MHLAFNIRKTQHLTNEMKGRLAEIKRNLINTEGELHLQSQEFRTQPQNKERVIEKFTDIMMEALTEPEERIETQPTASSNEKRLKGKQTHSKIKKDRQRKYTGE